MKETAKKSVSFKDTIDSRSIDKMSRINRHDIFYPQSSSVDHAVNYTLLTKDHNTSGLL